MLGHLVQTETLTEPWVPGRPGTPPLTSRNAGRLQVEGRSGRPCTGRRSLPWLPPLVMRHAADALHPLRTCGTSARRAAGRPAALRQRRWVVGAWVPGVVVVGAVALGAVVLGTAPAGAVVVATPAGAVVIGADA